MKQLARALRKNMTDAEKALWHRLRHRQLAGHKFRRQEPIGPFIADFVCTAKKLIIEVDGGQHAVNAEADRRRTSYLEEKGYRVLRFWNNEVLTEKEAVLERILAELDSPSPPGNEHSGAGSDPLPQWGRGGKLLSHSHDEVAGSGKNCYPTT